MILRSHLNIHQEKGTKAIEYDNQLGEDEKQHRLTKVLKLQKLNTGLRNQSYVNKVVDVLIEKKSKRNERKWAGRTDSNKWVIFDRLDFNINDIVPVLITKSKGITLYGEISKNEGGLIHLIKNFLLIVFNLIIIVFMTQNSNEKVDIFFLSYSLNDIYLNVVLLFNLLFGVAAGFLASVFIIISNKSEFNSIKN